MTIFAMQERGARVREGIGGGEVTSLTGPHPMWPEKDALVMQTGPVVSSRRELEVPAGERGGTPHSSEGTPAEPGRARARRRLEPQDAPASRVVTRTDPLLFLGRL